MEAGTDSPLLTGPQDPDHTSPAPRPVAPAARLVLPISRRNPFAHEPSQEDTKPIRAKRWEHYHIAFFAKIRPMSAHAAVVCLGFRVRACVGVRAHTRSHGDLSNTGMKNGGSRLDDWHGVVADYRGASGRGKRVALAMDVT